MFQLTFHSNLKFMILIWISLKIEEEKTTNSSNSARVETFVVLNTKFIKNMIIKINYFNNYLIKN